MSDLSASVGDSPTQREVNNDPVLVVEDDPDQRALYCRWLELDGYAAVALSTGEQVLDWLGERDAGAVCLDLGLGGMSGLEVLDRIGSLKPGLSVAILTADDRVESAVQATKLGAFDYVTKPVSREKLATVVRNALERTHMALRLERLESRSRGPRPEGLIGESGSMQALMSQIQRVAGTDVTVLIRGESGTGKELVARTIHAMSARNRARMVTLNCAAIPQALQESELFGHERGAFTGATGRRKGRFEVADGGTLFLDELGELASDLQPKLLRVLQERRFQRVGGNEDIESDFRLVTATNRDLRAEVKRGAFREDLFFRVAVFEIEVPPLRARGTDVILLADRFAGTYGERHRGRPLRISPDAADRLTAYTWPGNVRELENAIQRAVIVAEDETILPRHLPDHLRAFSRAVPRRSRDAGEPAPTLKNVEKDMILAAMRDTGGNVSEVARRLDIGRTTLYSRLREYGLR